MAAAPRWPGTCEVAFEYLVPEAGEVGRGACVYWLFVDVSDTLAIPRNLSGAGDPRFVAIT